MSAKKKLFGNNIEPACTYCVQGRPTADKMVLCCKFGPVAPYFKCNKFKYDPLKRVPKPSPKLPSFTPEDFSL